jgi:WXG100 family type VII secretion target
MALIQVTPDMLRARSGDVRKCRGEHDSNVQRLTQIINGLNEVWRGGAQDAFVERFRSMEPQFRSFSEMLEGYATLMDKAAQELQSTDDALKGTMNSFG